MILVLVEQLPKVKHTILVDDYSELFNSPQWSDIIFELDDGSKIYGHKLILTKRSNYFHSLFCDGFAETELSVIKIQRFRRGIVMKLLEFIYTGWYYSTHLLLIIEVTND